MVLKQDHPQALSEKRSPAPPSSIFIQAARIYHRSNLYRCIATVEDALDKENVETVGGPATRRLQDFAARPKHDVKNAQLLVDTRLDLRDAGILHQQISTAVCAATTEADLRAACGHTYAALVHLARVIRASRGFRPQVSSGGAFTLASVQSTELEEGDEE